jgi:hypothetical protein
LGTAVELVAVHRKVTGVAVLAAVMSCSDTLLPSVAG